MNELEVVRDKYYPPLAEDERKAILAHLKKGGHPVSAAAVTGISAERLMDFFNSDHAFAKECSIYRAKALAELEYALHEMATTGPPREAIKAIELALGANIPEIYAINSGKAEEKIKKIVNKGK